MTRKVLLIAGIMAVTVIAGVYSWVQSADPSTIFATAQVTRGDLRQNVLAVGRLRAKELVAVGAQVSGQVTRLYVALGQHVKAGDLIAEVDAQPQELALRSAEAAVASLKAQLVARQAALAQAELNFRRQEALLAGDATTAADHESSKATLDTARAEVQSLSAQITQALTQVETARINVAYTRIVAPMDGVIVSVVTKQGQTLNSFQTTPTIVMLAKLDVMTVRAEIAEADVDKLLPGQPVTFTTLGDTRQPHTARIERIEPAPESIVNDAGGGSGIAGATAGASRAVYYNALFDVANPAGRLRPSMTAQVSVLVKQLTNVLVVPAAALGKRVEDDVYLVRVTEAGERVTERRVRVGLRTHSHAQVLSGLAEGDRVVLAEASLVDPADGAMLGF